MSKEKQSNWFARHKILTAILVLIVVVAIGSSSSKSSNNNSNSGSQNNTTESTAETVGLNQPAKDGKFEFVVKNIECGKSSVSDSSGYLSKSAQGQYCFLTISVKNIGDQQQMFIDSNQKLLNAEGQQFSPDSTATLYKSNNSNVWLSQINPGNTVEGMLVFDLPKDQTPAVAQLHDSAFSGGIKVNL